MDTGNSFYCSHGVRQPAKVRWSGMPMGQGQLTLTNWQDGLCQRKDGWQDHEHPDVHYERDIVSGPASSHWAQENAKHAQLKAHTVLRMYVRCACRCISSRGRMHVSVMESV